MPKSDDPRNRKSSPPTAEEEFAALPRWKQSRANKQELQEGWPVYIPPEDFSTGRGIKGHRFFREQPKTSARPEVGPKPLNNAVAKVIEVLADYATYGKVEPDRTNASPSTPPNPQEATRFRDIVQRIEESERTPQLKVRPPKKG
jgi:hypothetical protein